MKARQARFLAVGLALAAVPSLWPDAGFAAADAAPRALTVTTQQSPVETTLFAVSFGDALHGHAVGFNHTLVRTQDGGQTWLPATSPVRGEERITRRVGTNSVQSQMQQPFEAVSFVDADHGHAVSGDGSIVATSDGGATWEVQGAPQPADVYPTLVDRPSSWSYTGVSFTDPDHGYVVGAFGLILKTSDGGATWSFQGDMRYGNLTGVSFVDKDHGQVVGHVTGKPDGLTYVTLSTFDGGTTWTATTAGKQAESVEAINFDSVQFTDPLHGVVVGGTGRIFVTFDGGKSWRIRRSGTNEQLEGVAFADNRRGLAVGTVDFQGEPRSQMLVTVDGGQSWRPQPLPDLPMLRDVTFADRSTAYAVGCTRLGPPEADPVDNFQLGRSCVGGNIVKIDFPELPPDVEEGGGGSGFPLPLVLVVGAVVVACGGIVFWVRRS